MGNTTEIQTTSASEISQGLVGWSMLKEWTKKMENALKAEYIYIHTHTYICMYVYIRVNQLAISW